MSKKSDEIAARRAALGLKVISNETGTTSSSASTTSIPSIPSTPAVPQLPSAQNSMVGSGFERRRPASSEIAVHSGVPTTKDFPRESCNKPSPIKVASVNGNSEDIEVKASTFAQWLEEQYHGNIAPFAFVSDVALNVDDLPDDAVVEKACHMLRSKGWQIAVHYFDSAGCRAGRSGCTGAVTVSRCGTTSRCWPTRGAARTPRWNPMPPNNCWPRWPPAWACPSPRSGRRTRMR